MDATPDAGMISVDDHLVEPPHVWTARLPSSMRDRSPRVVKSDGGGDQWVFEDQVVPLLGMAAVAGVGEAGYRDAISFDEMRPSCYDAKARVADLDLDRILASACFPTWVGFSGTRLSAARDKSLGLACIQAYNDFVIDEWCEAAPGRYIPVALVPLWDQRAAADEAERAAAKGARAVAFSENPSQQGYPSIHDRERRWDRLFSVVSEARMPLCLHIGSSSHIYHPPSPDSPLTVLFTTDYMNSQYSLVSGCSATTSIGSRAFASASPREGSAGCRTASSGAISSGNAMPVGPVRRRRTCRRATCLTTCRSA
jgi:hypothetical protein